MTIATAPVPAPIGFGELFSRSWEVFKRNWIVALPPVIAGVIAMAGMFALIAAIAVVAISSGGFQHDSARTGPALVLIGIGTLVYFAFVFVVMLWAYDAMFGMADAAWTRGSATFGDGFAAFRRSAGATFVAVIGLIGLVLVAFILAFPTLFLSILALPFVTMYILPSVVVGGRGGFEAIGESFRLLRRFFVPSLITMLVLMAIAYGIGMIGSLGIIPLEFSVMPTGNDTTPHVPPLGLAIPSAVLYVLSLLASLAYGGFQAIALVGLYRDLIAQPEVPRVQRLPPPPSPPAPTPT